MVSGSPFSSNATCSTPPPARGRIYSAGQPCAQQATSCYFIAGDSLILTYRRRLRPFAPRKTGIGSASVPRTARAGSVTEIRASKSPRVYRAAREFARYRRARVSQRLTVTHSYDSEAGLSAALPQRTRAPAFIRSINISNTFAVLSSRPCANAHVR